MKLVPGKNQLTLNRAATISALQVYANRVFAPDGIKVVGYVYSRKNDTLTIKLETDSSTKE